MRRAALVTGQQMQLGRPGCHAGQRPVALRYPSMLYLRPTLKHGTRLP